MSNSAIVRIDDLPPSGLLRQPWTYPGFPLKRSEVYRRIGLHSFPPPVKIGSRASAWRIGELHAWLADPLAWRPAGSQ
jgi:predicted DNA-binding transcriptional regulator AlpA